MKRLALLFALTSCSPVYYAATRRCPTTTMAVSDVLLSVAAGTIAGLHWKNHPGRSAVEGAVAVALWGGATVAEVKCGR
jgi:hypothetical protein